MKKALLVWVASLFWLPFAAHADTWIIQADSWCPYNCDPKSPNPGYMIEIISLAAKATGNTVEYKLTPWSRALDEAKSGNISGVVGISDGDREGFLLSEKLGVDSNCLFVNPDSTYKYTGPQDLSKLNSVGTSQGYVYPDEFMEWQKTNAKKVQAIAGDNTLEVNAKKLKGKRIDALIENSSVVDYAKKSIPELKDVVSSGCFSTSNLYAGFGAKNPKSAGIVKAVNAKIAELKASGELKKILGKYGVAAW